MGPEHRVLRISAQDGPIITAATPALAPACCLPQGREAEAQRVLMQCVHASPEMAHELMLRLRCAGLLPQGPASRGRMWCMQQQQLVCWQGLPPLLDATFQAVPPAGFILQGAAGAAHCGSLRGRRPARLLGIHSGARGWGRSR